MYSYWNREVIYGQLLTFETDPPQIIVNKMRPAQNKKPFRLQHTAHKYDSMRCVVILICVRVWETQESEFVSQFTK